MYRVKLKPCVPRYEYIPDSEFDKYYKKEISDIYKSLLSGNYVSVDNVHKNIFEINKKNFYLITKDFIIKEIK